MVKLPPWMSAGRSLPPCARGDHVLAAGGDRREPQRVGAVDHGDDEAVLDGDRQADIDLGMARDRTVAPRGVHGGVAGQRGGDELHQEVGVGDAPAGLLLRLLAPGGEPADIDLAEQVEVRRGGPACGHPLGHDAPHGADALAVGRPGGRGRNDRCDGRRDDVRGEDSALRAGAAHGVDVEAALGGEPPRLGRRRVEADGRSVGRPVDLARRVLVAGMSGRRRHPRLDMCEDVGLLDPAGARLHLRQVDAVLLGDLPGEGRGLDRPREPRRETATAAGAARLPLPRARRSGRWPGRPGSRRPPARSRSSGCPTAGASISVVTLSVSISRSGSPLATASPGALSQRMTLPVSCASSSAGMMTDVAIRLSGRAPWPPRRRPSRSAPSDPRGRARTVSARPWRRCA